MTVRGLFLCMTSTGMYRRAPCLLVCSCGRCTSLLCSRGMLQALEVVAALPPSTVDRPCPPALWVGALGLVGSCHAMCRTTHTHLRQRQLCACTCLPAADLPPVVAGHGLSDGLGGGGGGGGGSTFPLASAAPIMRGSSSGLPAISAGAGAGAGAAAAAVAGSG